VIVFFSQIQGQPVVSAGLALAFKRSRMYGGLTTHRYSTNNAVDGMDVAAIAISCMGNHCL